MNRSKYYSMIRFKSVSNFELSFQDIVSRFAKDVLEYSVKSKGTFSFNLIFISEKKMDYR